MMMERRSRDRRNSRISRHQEKFDTNPGNYTISLLLTMLNSSDNKHDNITYNGKLTKQIVAGSTLHRFYHSRFFLTFLTLEIMSQLKPPVTQRKSPVRRFSRARRASPVSGMTKLFSEIKPTTYPFHIRNIATHKLRKNVHPFSLMGVPAQAVRR